MSDDLLERARQTVEGARKRGAQGARAWVTRSRQGSVEWRDGKLDRLRESTQLGLSVTLYVDGRYSSNSTSDLRPEALGAFLDETVAATRVLAPDRHRMLPDPARYGDRFTGDLQIFDSAGAGAMSGDVRRQQARELYEAARSAPGSEHIISVTTDCTESVGESVVVASNGLEATTRSTRFSTYAETTVRDEGNRKPEGWAWAEVRAQNALPAAAVVAEEATRRALQDRGGRPRESGLFPCVVENRVVGRLLGGLLAPLSGRAIQQQQSFLADKLGQRIADARLSITDEPLLPAGLDSTSYDGEGMSTMRRPILEHGVLRTFFLDTYYASKLGREPTTAGTSNLVFTAGKRDLAGLLADLGTGILITGFSGGNSNSATGDFSLGIRGQWVERGQLTRPVAEMNLSGNHLTFWNQVLDVGADPFPYSSTRSPSLRFGPVQFSGA